MREVENKLETILKEIKSNKAASTATNPISDVDEMQDSQLLRDSKQLGLSGLAHLLLTIQTLKTRIIL